MKKWLVILMLTPSLMFGQSGTLEREIEDWVSSQELTDADFNVLVDQLDELRLKPINLNDATATQLAAIPCFSPITISAILDYRTKAGDFTDWNELFRVEGVDSRLLDCIKPYTTVERRETGNRNNFTFWKNGRFEHNTKIEGQIGSKSKNPYPGNPFKIYTRTRYLKPQRLSVGLVTEKDPGEMLFNNQHKYSPDFTSFHLAVKPDKKIIRELVIGDFTFSSGLGLVFSNGFSLSKSTQITQLLRPASGLKPYTSTTESGFFRGIGSTLKFGRSKLTSFMSHQKIDATVKDDSITSLYNTGLHRTDNELARRKIATENTAGFTWQTEFEKIDVGISGSYTLLSKPTTFYSPTTTVAIYGVYHLNNGLVFIETSPLLNQPKAMVGGLIIALSKQMSGSVIYRNYDSNFTSKYGNSFANSSTMKNERGLFIGLEWVPSYSHKIACYIDEYTYPSKNFFSNFPARQSDKVIQYQFTIKNKIMFYARLRTQQLQRDFLEENYKVPGLVQQINQRIHAEWKIKKKATIKFRIETSGSSLFKPSGSLAYLDFQWKPLESKGSITVRIARFSVNNYQNRIYAYESDLPFSFSIPAYNNQGWRTYLVYRQKIIKSLDVWVRLANWYITSLNSQTSTQSINLFDPKISIQARYVIGKL